MNIKKKIAILKNKLDELSNELILLKGGNVNKNSYYNASFINNSIINTNSIPKYHHDNEINPNLMKTYSHYNTRFNTQNNDDKNRNLNYKYIKVTKNDNNMHKFNTTASINRNQNNNNNIYNINNINNINNTNKRFVKNQNKRLQTNNTQDFINRNKEEDKNHIKFLKEYKETLDKFQTFK